MSQKTLTRGRGDCFGLVRVQRATITVGGRHLELDFISFTASARTSGRPPLTDILGVGLPLLWPLAELDVAAFMTMMTEARQQQTLELFSQITANARPGRLAIEGQPPARVDNESPAAES